MKYDTLRAAISNPKYSWMKTLAFCLLVVLAVAARNLKPITYPTLYAEDGKWLGQILTGGFWNTALYGRGDFPVVGVVGLLYTALGLVKVFFAGNLSFLPHSVFFVATAFVSIMAILAYRLAPAYLSLSAKLALLAAVVLMPVGDDGNEIFGRLLNLGFVFPVLQVTLIVHLLENKVTKFGLILSFAYLLLAGLSFPVCIVFNGIAAGVFVLRYFWDSSRRSERHDLLLTLGFILVSICAVLTLDRSAFTNKGGANAPFSPAGFIDFTFARCFLYPFVYPFYQYLNNSIVVVLSVVTAVGLIAGSLYVAVMRPKYRYAVGFLAASWLCYYLATVIMRNGFTSLFGQYINTFPDRYFYGLNSIFLFYVIFLGHAIFSESLRLRLREAVSWCVLIILLVGVEKHFEFTKPRLDWGQLGTFAFTLCQQNQNRGPLPVDPAAATLTVPIYPVLPDFGWRIEIPKQDLGFMSQVDCEKILNKRRWKPF